MDDLIITDNSKFNRFETNLGDDFAFIEYRYSDGDIALIHTFVPESHRGHGIAGRLIKKVLDYLRSQKKSIKVICPTIHAYISIHPEYIPMVEEDTL